MTRRPSYAGWIALAIVLILALFFTTTYNGLVASQQAVQAQWGQVQNVYQRRADLVPNLVATVKGAANFEKSTYIAVAQARASVGQITPQALQGALDNPKTFAQYQQAQGSLGAALSRLLVVTENYPDLKANENFLTLQSQLEGTENRIAVERKRFNDLAQAFNTRRDTMPTALIADLFGSKFAERPYFAASSQAQSAPQVQF
ncbi:MAG TPA: LemA family protein [Verrucomicrobiae bacterium]|jgi:LemA protein|nr:LemA family protein [Verrucomicrobiae bacterium]